MAIAILNKNEEIVKNTTTVSKYIPRRSRISINWNSPFQTSLHKNSKEIFFRLAKIFFQEQKIFVQGTTFVQFFRYCKAKEKKINKNKKIKPFLETENWIHVECKVLINFFSSLRMKIGVQLSKIHVMLIFISASAYFNTICPCTWYTKMYKISTF